MLQTEGEDFWPYFRKHDLKIIIECEGIEDRIRAYKFHTYKAYNDIWTKCKMRQERVQRRYCHDQDNLHKMEEKSTFILNTITDANQNPKSELNHYIGCTATV